MPTLRQQQGSYTETDASIDTVGEVIAQAEIPGDRLVSLNIEAGADASYALDVSGKREPTDADADWFLDETTFDKADVDDPQDIRDGFRMGDRHIRVRVTEAAAQGETADVTIQVA